MDWDDWLSNFKARQKIGLVAVQKKQKNFLSQQKFLFLTVLTELIEIIDQCTEMKSMKCITFYGSPTIKFVVSTDWWRFYYFFMVSTDGFNDFYYLFMVVTDGGTMR